MSHLGAGFSGLDAEYTYASTSFLEAKIF
jgi:hypothetical protein